MHFSDIGTGRGVAGSAIAVARQTFGKIMHFWDIGTESGIADWAQVSGATRSTKRGDGLRQDLKDGLASIKARMA